ncbi:MULTISPECIES: twin-arginine translocase subunit TatC [Flavobacteriaceae]|uniref:Sec-independent protein translocase protein TatC n=2 Tax=Flavobacteriaceae TaxID=49546 RepID=A0A4Y8AWH2_9FLAO|nr:MULTISPECIES: twin-arginine translocase subunit TatC [Flavobacteriaceae]TEW76372.1 twin-arginine translocase subunit TatC [Gramella jeungdoensis]GGK52334.1 Sec-independent protein translocase protein TatC [Lutibacter litoralis]
MAKVEKEMSFLDHVEELRWHLVRSSMAIFFFGIIAFVMKGFIFNTILFAPKDANFLTYRVFCQVSQFFGTEGLCIEDIPFTFQSLAMAEQFSVHIWTSITVGFILAFPFILWEVWKFISPGLYEKERKSAKSFIFISSFLFFIGVLFGYYVVTPLSVNFLGNYSVSDAVERNIKIGSYISLVRSSLLASGFIFELPIIMYFLTKMGLITPDFLRKYRKHALVLVLVLAAVITPPDIISQIIVAIPILMLYELSIYISKIVIKRELKRSKQNA